MLQPSSLARLRDSWLRLHTRKEELFWTVKMGLADDPGAASRELEEADRELADFLQDASNLSLASQLAGAPAIPASDRIEAEGWRRLFATHTVADSMARSLSAEILRLEAELGRARAAFETGYTDPGTGAFIRASTNHLALLIANDPSEAVRKAALDGLLDVERFVLDHGFLDIVRLRNRLGRRLGYEDYYDWKANIAEGQGKRAIFDRLERFLGATQASTEAALRGFAAEHGEGALFAHNFAFMRGGATAEAMEPWLQFGPAFGRWGRSFAALGIRFRGATLTLDLVDRPGKYENGFMHGPGPAWFKDGAWQPARINFTANAVPGAVGSGLRATVTLFHEGGHAAHFANITAGSPCWSNEYPPTSVAYAETQSMFLDSLVSDPDWRARYARDVHGEPMPFELIAKEIRESQPFRGWDTRRLITVPMGERMLYELPEEDLNPACVIERLRNIEREVQGLSASARPILAVPHLISAESSAYYHAYILAEMAVAQTRAFFLSRDGFLTDNPRIGPDLATSFWAPGNRVSHDETLVALTGEPLSADALIAEANRGIDEVLVAAEVAWRRGQRAPLNTEPVELDARVRVMHGRQLICDTADMAFDEAASAFETWIRDLESLTGSRRDNAP